MQQLVGAVNRVSSLVDDVAGATVQQSQGLQAFSGTVRELEGLTQQNAALVEQSAASAGSLDEQAARLQDAVSRFRVAA
jgi:methyl-accepting chemotaxis protein